MKHLMTYILGLIVISTVWQHPAVAQQSYSIEGRIVNAEQEPLAGAAIYLKPYNKGLISDKNGHYNIKHLSAGKYIIDISYMGYKSYKDTLSIHTNTQYNVVLHPSSLNLQEVKVEDHYTEQRKREEALSIEVVNEDYVKQHLGGSLMSSLERLPGVSTIGIGSGQSKPVIRGLSFNRVLVVENNIKHEGQQWGSDHGLEIDQYAVDNIEVIKGPASLMYGSDAIGGVIAMKNRKLPTPNSYGASLDLSGKTNNDLLGSSLNVYARKKDLYMAGRVTVLDYGDLKVPTDSIDIYSYRAALDDRHLRNTAGHEKNVHFTLGLIKRQWQSKLYISSINNESGFFANAYGLEPRRVNTDLHNASTRDIHYPYQQAQHFKAISSSFYQWDTWRAELDLGLQRNFRQEWSNYVQHGYMPATYPDSLGGHSDLEREFDKYIYSAQLKFSHQPQKPLHFNYGASADFQDNTIGGHGFIIPQFKQFNIGTYALVNYQINPKSKLQAGLRYDYGNINTKSYHDWYPTPLDEKYPNEVEYLQRAQAIERAFTNLSWSLGYNYNATHWFYKVNMGKSFRMPIAKELAANGVNFHRFSYEIGDANLSPEISYQLDAGIDYHTTHFAIGATPFINYFTNYIYLNPTSEHDRLYGNGNQKFYYRESEVFRFGGEVHAHYKVLKNLQLGIVGEYVYSEQMTGDKKGYTLPFSPPASGILNIKYHRNHIYAIRNPYASLDYRLTAAQNRIVPPEKMTEASQVVNLALGGDIRIHQQEISINIQIQNILNTKYFNHTSYYRLINIPEAGRNLIVTIRIPISKPFTN